MSVLEIILWIFLVFGVLPSLVLSYIIFSVLMVRTKPEKWSHECSQPDDPEVVSMYDQGVAWRRQYERCRRPVELHNQGLKLYGEYFDFGSQRAVIILPGRMEACYYSCYFAEPYRQAGYNVLVIDGQAHGLSDGKYNYVGYREYRDILAWGEWLHQEAGNAKVLLHGICIGASTMLFASTSPDTPDYLQGLVVEGMYKCFYQSFKNHMQKDKRPLFPFLYIVMGYIRLLLGINVVTDGPYKRILKLKKPILMLHGRLDAFSLPHLAQEMYDSCPAEKRLVWFDKGSHSRLRINNTEAYDRELLDFAARLNKGETC